ncbi:MAG: NADH-quinone oxidoreductase subunit K [Chloroflexi bacterium]|nr:NADH-quinone oxidoreductase subunit K [Chloroflexota bacterium]
MSFTPLTAVLIGVIGLLGAGFYGLLISRNLIKVVVSLQILGKTAVLALVMAGNSNGQINISQSLAITVIVADTIVAVVGLALAVQVRRLLGTLDIKALSNLKR